MADPWSGSRTFAALLACVIFGAGAVGIRAWSRRSGARVADRPTLARYDPDRFYFGSLDLVDAAIVVGMVIAAAGLLVALAEGIVSRRRAYAALVATGVPARHAGRLDPVAGARAGSCRRSLLALAVGTVLARGIATEVSRTDSSCVGDVCTDLPTVTRAVPVLWGDLLRVAPAGSSRCW